MFNLRKTIQSFSGINREWNKLVLVQHYEVNWEKMKPMMKLKMMTPLFQLSMMPDKKLIRKRLYSDQRGIVISFPFSKKAASSRIINSVRSTILKCFNESKYIFQEKEVVQISLFPCARIASLKDLT